MAKKPAKKAKGQARKSQIKDLPSRAEQAQGVKGGFLPAVVATAVVSAASSSSSSQVKASEGDTAMAIRG